MYQAMALRTIVTLSSTADTSISFLLL